ncbi:MAG: DUF748 domain-containing protein [Proteobacteria bacterium]|nr:DUF748 domain-containing protein [Pseudomonadota bacterium]HQR04631.1 DUF748 domain-containing protein [Rhodocyclaceae bacterium]
MKNPQRLSTVFQNIVRRRALRVFTAVIAVFFVLFGLAGYFWLPGFAKAKLETILGEQLHRPVTIERIAISPYTLSATMEGFRAGDVLAVKSAHVDISATSLVRRIPVISEVKVEGVNLHLVRESATRLNVSDLLDKWLGKKDDSPTPEFWVSNISLKDGRIELVDKVDGGTQLVSDIALGIPFVANVPSKTEVFVEPHFSARINGAPLTLTGRIRPFATGHDAVVDINLDKFDLTRISAYARLPFRLHSALLGTRIEVRFRKPVDQAPAVTVAGNLDLSGIDLTLADPKVRFASEALRVQNFEYDVMKGRATVERCSLGTGGHGGLAIGDDGAEKRAITLGDAVLSGLRVDLSARDIQADSLTLGAPSASITRSGDGRFDLVDLFASHGETSPASTRPGGNAPPPAWRWSLAKFGLSGGALSFTDAGLPDAPTLHLSDISLDGTHLASSGAPAESRLKATVNERGHIDAAGKIGLADGGALTLDLGQVDLVALQGFAGERFNALLTRGALDFRGKVSWREGNVHLDGDGALSDVSILDRINAEDLLRWKQLRIGALTVATAPLAVDVGSVALSNFYAKVLINPEGHLNLRDILKPASREPAPAAPASAPASTTQPVAVTSAPASATEPRIRIGSIRLDGGDVNFNDRFIKPNYSARIGSLTGTIGALSAGTLSMIDLRGKVDRAAPLEISGRIDPLSSPPGLDIRAIAKGIDMPPFSSYSARYLGYMIDKGKLSMDVSYKVDKGELVAENQIFLDQLTLGDKVESKDAVSLPVSLALSLLKNARGEIDLNLPLRGSINDPEFSVGGIVFKVLVNLLEKAVTAPFALLGSLFGGGEDLSQVAFAPGQAGFTPEIESRLQSLAKAMADRPALVLEVTGVADPAVDREGLKQVMLDHRLRALKLADTAKRGKKGADLSEVTLTTEERAHYLERLYKDSDLPDRPRNLVGMIKTLPVAEMEARLLQAQDVSDADLKHLADDRAQRVQAWLSDTGGVPATRVFVLAPRVAAGAHSPGGGQVAFSLR